MKYNVLNFMEKHRIKHHAEFMEEYSHVQYSIVEDPTSWTPLNLDSEYERLFQLIRAVDLKIEIVLKEIQALRDEL